MAGMKVSMPTEASTRMTASVPSAPRESAAP